MFDLALSLVRLLEGARGPRVYRPFPFWYGYIDGVRIGFVRLFREPLKPLDQYGFPRQPWVWGAQMRQTGNSLYIEGAQAAPPLGGVRPLLLEARALGCRYLSLDRLRGADVVSKIYDLDRILGSGEKTQSLRMQAESNTQDFQAEVQRSPACLKAGN